MKASESGKPRWATERMACLPRRTASGDLSTTRSSRASVAWSSSAIGTTRFTRPAASALAASTESPVTHHSNSSLAGTMCCSAE